jgi:transposase
MNNIIVIGIDISKKKFDVSISNLKTKKVSKVFSNNLSGFEQLKAMLPNGSEVIAALEATGCYGENLTRFLYNNGVKVFVLNPAQVKNYAKSMMLRTKTDKVDCEMIANFLMLHKEQLQSWAPPLASLEKLKGLHRCSEDLKGDGIRIKGRIEACENTDDLGKKEALTLYKEQLKFIEKNILEIEKKILILIEECPELSHKFMLLNSIPCVAQKTAIAILAELPDVSIFNNAKQLAAYAGLNPAIRESGSSVRGRGSISHIGSAHLRKLLFLPAMTALRCNPIIKAFGDRLKAKQKNGKVVIVAAMRKLLHIIFGVLKTGEVFKVAA